MPKKENTNSSTELLELLLIVELLKLGTTQLDIRKLIGCDIYKINKLAKLIKKGKKNN